MADDFLHALPRGTRLEEYEIESVLGHGGFGITYLGRDVVLGLYLAIKEYMPADLCVRIGDGEIRPKSESSVDNFEWGLDRFVSEAKLLAIFSHPNIVPVQRYFTANGTAYLAMPFQEGESLGDLIQREDLLSPEKLKSIVVPCLNGLEEVHKADFLHRDIKPDNIFIREDGSPLLLDFGAARQALGGKTRAITAVATPGFAPMEQYFADGNQGPWTDIYAMACVMYRAIGGKMPPESPARVEDDPMVPLDELAGPEWDRAFLTAVERGMSPKAKDRPQTVGEWLEDLYSGKDTGRIAAPAQEAGATIAIQEPRKADPGATIIDRNGTIDSAAARSGPGAGKPRSGGDEAPAEKSPARAAAAEAAPARPKRGAAPKKDAAPPPAKRERKKDDGIPAWVFAAGSFVLVMLVVGVGLAALGLFDSAPRGGTGGGTGNTGGGDTTASTGSGSGASEIGSGGASGEGGDGGFGEAGGSGDGANGEGTGGEGTSGASGEGSSGEGSSGAADAEAKAKAEAEAKKKAAEDRKKKAEREARRKAEREAKKKAEEEARKKAEQEAKAAAAPKVAGATIYRFKSTRMPTVKQAYTITFGGGGALIGKFDYIGGPGGAAPGEPGKDRGKWWMKGAQLCTKWSKWEGGGTKCYTLKKSGKGVSASGGGLLAGKIK